MSGDYCDFCICRNFCSKSRLLIRKGILPDFCSVSRLRTLLGGRLRRKSAPPEDCEHGYIRVHGIANAVAKKTKAQGVRNLELSDRTVMAARQCVTFKCDSSLTRKLFQALLAPPSNLEGDHVASNLSGKFALVYSARAGSDQSPSAPLRTPRPLC